MAPFRAEDARYFYRREEIERMLRHLHHKRLLFVAGLSGSGNSSLMRTGLLSPLAKSNLFPTGFWFMRELCPSGWGLAVLRYPLETVPTS
jgi:hypothetical protein